MLDTEDDILGFKQFVAAGGIQPPQTLLIGRDALARSQALLDDLVSVIVDENDYTQVQAFFDAVNNTHSVVQQTAAIVSEWNTYLEDTAIPEGLSIPSQGHDILCKLNDVDNDAPAPFTVPILQSSEILALQTAIIALEPVSASSVALMNEINDALLLTPSSIPSDLIANSESQALELNDITDDVNSSSSLVSDALSLASQNKVEATEAYYQAIAYTIANSQLSDPAIKDAVSEIYPST
ncbi:TPA: hypothetical protein ACVU5P_004160 [Vibrio parahaemolyticus]